MEVKGHSFFLFLLVRRRKLVIDSPWKSRWCRVVVGLVDVIFVSGFNLDGVRCVVLFLTLRWLLVVVWA